MLVSQKLDCLDLEHVCHVVPIIFPGVESLQKCSISILQFLLQAGHRRLIIESLSRVDDVNELRFEGSTADEEAIDIGLESYLRSRSASIIPQATR